jgi:3-methyladenine DNA glycosylase AlkD
VNAQTPTNQCSEVLRREADRRSQILEIYDSSSFQSESENGYEKASIVTNTNIHFLPERVTASQMDRWCRDFDNWGIVDTVCFKLFDQVPHAARKAVQWCSRKDEFQKRAGYVLMACVGVHDKKAADEQFIKFLPLIENDPSNSSTN